MVVIRCTKCRNPVGANPLATPRLLANGDTVCSGCCLTSYGTIQHNAVNYDLLPHVAHQASSRTPRVCDRHLLLQPLNVQYIGDIRRLLEKESGLLIVQKTTCLSPQSQSVHYGYNVFHPTQNVVFLLHHPSLSWVRMRAKGLRFTAESYEILPTPRSQMYHGTLVACNGVILVTLSFGMLAVYDVYNVQTHVRMRLPADTYTRVDCPNKHDFSVWVWRADGVVLVYRFDVPHLALVPCPLIDTLCQSTPLQVGYYAGSTDDVEMVVHTGNHELHFYRVHMGLIPQVHFKRLCSLQGGVQFVALRATEVDHIRCASFSSLEGGALTEIFFEPLDE